MREDTHGRKGWEIAKEVEDNKPSFLDRAMPNKDMLMAVLKGAGAFFVVFLVGCWLAGNPFEATQRLPSEVVKLKGWLGTDQWAIFWHVVLLVIFFDYMDSAAGMGFGTALTPLLLVLGFDPKQIVPAVMIQQGTAGLVSTYLHKEFENVEWRFKPMSETIKLWLIVSIVGCLAVAFSITAVYAYLKMAKIWIKVYVAILLLMMGAVSVYQTRKERPYRPGKMFGFAALAGFNKGVGGGGYGPVVTIGGLLSGVPVKSMLAITAICEGTVSMFAVIVWLALLTGGVTVDYLLLPSFMLGTIFATTLACYTTRALPERVLRYAVPVYCVIVAVICFWKLIPDLMAKLT